MLIPLYPPPTPPPENRTSIERTLNYELSWMPKILDLNPLSKGGSNLSGFYMGAGLQACNFVLKRLQHRYFPEDFAKFSRAPVLEVSMMANAIADMKFKDSNSFRLGSLV